MGTLEHLHHLSSSDSSSTQGKLDFVSGWGGLGAPQQCGDAAPCVKSLYSTQEQELSLKFPSFTFGSKVVVQIHSGGQRPLKRGELSIQRTSPVVFVIK